MPLVKVGSNVIDVSVSIVRISGFAGGEGGFHKRWVEDPAGQGRMIPANIEEKSGRKDGWVHRPDVSKWAFKPFGVNLEPGEPHRAPYLGMEEAEKRGIDLWPGEVMGRDASAWTKELAQCDAWYVGSTWAGDNRESPRGVAPFHQHGMRRVLDLIKRFQAINPGLKRLVFDQTGGVCDEYLTRALFGAFGSLLAAMGIDAYVEALPKDPQWLTRFGGFARYVYLCERGLMEREAGSRTWPRYLVPKGARLVIDFDGRVLRDERGEITADDVQRVVAWAAANGIEGAGAEHLDLMIVSPDHARAVVEWATANGVL